MLSVEEANGLIDARLGSAPRAAHSRFVGRLMRALAYHLGQDADLWEVVGLCHDLDYLEVAGDWTRHGPLTAEQLAGRLPAEALQAIAAHDHRAGVVADTELSDALRLADALTVACEQIGIERLRTRLAGVDLGGLRTDLGPRSYIADMVERIAGKRSILIGDLSRLIPG
jgi:predicted hydrolase (HD superfamily)